MAFKLEDRIRERWTGTGTGDVVTDYAASTFFSFASAYAIGDTFDYVIENQSTGEVEIGLGTYSALNTIQRTTVVKSSNGNALVNFSAGVKYISVVVRKAKFDGSVIASGGVVVATGLVTGSGLAFLDSAGDHKITLDTASNETADRTLTVPLLGGNRTLALLEQTQTFTGVCTFSADPFFVNSTHTGTAVFSTASSGVRLNRTSSTNLINESVDHNGSILKGGLTFQGGVTAFPSSGSDADCFITRVGVASLVPGAGVGALLYRPRVSDVAGRANHYFVSGSVGGVSVLAFEITEVGELRHWGHSANGQHLDFPRVLTEEITVLAQAFTDSALDLPAGAVILGVSCRTTAAIPTAATYTVTGATTGTVFNTVAVSGTLGTTNKGTAAGAYYNAAAQKVRITPSAVPGAATGKVRICVHYYTITPPAS